MLFIPTFLFGLEPPSDPILRIETGMHTAPVWRVDVDAEEKFIVTASDDKTIRLWQLGTGKLIKIFRPPIGEGNEGKIYSVAISPDGRHIAAGGWTQAGEESYNIYLFDSETGILLKRIGEVPSAINHLAYSKDGRYLVACLSGNNDIRVYRTDDYSLWKEDKDYGSDSYGAEFDSTGRLVTSSWDGYIRLYDREFRLIAKKNIRGGTKPYHISFSPNGSKIVIAFGDSTKIKVISGEDLSELYSPDTADIKNGNLISVAWSADGRFIYAGGKYNKGGLFPIIKWDGEGKGDRQVIVSNEVNAIRHILSLPKGGIVFGSAASSFGVIDSNNKVSVFGSKSIANYRDQNILVSQNGTIVQFGYKLGGKEPANFSVIEDKLDTPTLFFNREKLNPPITSHSNFNITNWKYSFRPKLNDRELSLEQHEHSISLAIVPDRQSFLLGTDRYLRLFDKNGNIKWTVTGSGVAWSVNISGDGNLAIAAFGDGTIRWYRITDGKELLSFFPHKDKKRWVLWTPKGYYTVSPNGEDLIGWHINNGKDKSADFYPVGRFRERFYRPNVIAKIFSTYDEDRAIAIANEELGRKRLETSIKDILPPVVTVIAPADGTKISEKEITVKYLIKNPSNEPEVNLKILIDGRPISQERGIKIVGSNRSKGSNSLGGSNVQELKVMVPERDFELSLVAENKFSASEPYTIRLLWAGKKEEYVVKPKLYILAIGLSQYKDPSLRLNFADKDAEDFVRTMSIQKGRLYDDVKVKLLVNENAIKDEILDGLEWLQKETTHKDIAMIFIAGHGVNDSAGVYYFLPHNADLEKLKRTGLPFTDIKNTVASIAGKVAMFVDTCHSGNVMGKRAITDITGVINELSSAENGVVVFSSSTGRQYSLEDPSWGNGAFTKTLVEGLQGSADFLGKGKITINMLDAFIAERVKEITKGKQTPVTTKPNSVPDFPIAVK